MNDQGGQKLDRWSEEIWRNMRNGGAFVMKFPLRKDLIPVDAPDKTLRIVSHCGLGCNSCDRKKLDSRYVVVKRCGVIPSGGRFSA